MDEETMPRRKLPEGFVGYVRVSTERQGDDGNSLSAQKFQLEEYVRGVGGELEIVPAMEPGHGPIAGRPRYLEAIKKAQERGWRILVLNPSRLSRDVEHLKHIDFRKTPVWVYREGQISKQSLIKAVEKAAWELEQLRRDGAAGARAREAGFRTGEASDRATAGRARGGDANADRAHRNMLRVQDYIERNPEAGELSHQKLADALNAARIQNRVKESPITDKPWTVGSLRPVRRVTMERIALDRELAVEDELREGVGSGTEALGAHPGPPDVPTKDWPAESKWGAANALRKAVGWVKKMVRSFADRFKG